MIGINTNAKTARKVPKMRYSKLSRIALKKRTSDEERRKLL
jgi:hypothetical protein